MGVKVWHTHFSSRFNKSAAGLEKLLDDNTDTTDWFTVTEIDGALRARCLREPGWGASLPRPHASPRDDCGQAWLRETLLQKWKDVILLSGLQYLKDGGGLAAPTICNVVVLEAKNGHRLLSAIAHLGHGVEGDLKDGKANSHNAKVYVADLKALIEKANYLAKQHDCDSVLITFDSNLDVRLAWVRLFLWSKGRGYKLNWRKPYPSKGTFGHRLIDVTMFRGKLRLTKGPRLVSQQGTSDHAYGYTEEYELFA